MVAKISVSGSLGSALTYNLRKVEKSEAQVLGTNKICCPMDLNFKASDCQRDFDMFMPQRYRTENPVFHVSLNPHPDDKLSDDELTSLAEDYIKYMGYENQPYMIFKHTDIDRHHLHVVSVRVREDGKKINDKFERRKSKHITRHLEQKYGLRPAEKRGCNTAMELRKVDVSQGDIKAQVGDVVRNIATRYRFLGFNEYRTVLSLYNVAAEEIKGLRNGKPYSGIIYSATDDNGNKIGTPFNSSTFGKAYGYDAIQKRVATSMVHMKSSRDAHDLKARGLDALHNSSNRGEFESELRKRNMNIIFRINAEGRIYGTTFIDHNNGCVLNGSRLGKGLSANDLTEWFANPQPIREVQGATLSSYTQERSHYSQRTEPTAVPMTEPPQTQERHHQVDNNSSIIAGALGILPDTPQGDDPEEDAFRHRMQQQQKKKRGRRM